MAVLTCAGSPAITGEIEIPAGGPWHALLRLDRDAALSGAVELRWEGATASWWGMVARGGVLVEGGPVEVLVVGGAGRLGRVLPGASYRQATVRVVLGQLLADAGEVLSSSTPAALLSRTLPRWSRAEGPAAAQLDALARVLGVGWRVLPSGQVWLGPAPSAVVLPADAVLLRRQPALGQIELTTGRPWELVPGGLFEGQRVASVRIELTPSRLRSCLCLS